MTPHDKKNKATRLFDTFTMEGKQGHFPKGTQFLEVYVQDGQQAIRNHETNSTANGSVFKPQLPFLSAHRYNQHPLTLAQQKIP